MKIARHSIRPDDKRAAHKHPYRDRYNDNWLGAYNDYRLQPTVYFLEALAYHERTASLQDANIEAWKSGLPGANAKCRCDLQDAIRIYDTIYRWSAGFSNVPQELMLGNKNPKKHFNKQHGLSFNHNNLDSWTRVYLLLVHRLCGSGASFATIGDSKLPQHGWYNTPVPYLATKATSLKEAVDLIRTYDRPMFSSIGNQIPPFNKPTGEFTSGGREYLCVWAPKLAVDTFEYLHKGPKKRLQPLVDWILDWQTEHGHRRFKFVLTAWAMDLAEYWPDVVDDDSDCYHGKNAIEAIHLCFDQRRSRPELGKQSFYDRATRLMADFGKTRPMDVEDAAPGCDFVRWIENYIQPRGYDNVDRKRVFNCSFIKHPAGRQPWKIGTSEWIWS